MKIEIPEPEQISTAIPDFVDALVYGPHGTGKTVFAARFPKPVLYLDSDKGILSVATSKLIPQSEKDQIHRVKIVNQSSDPHVKQPIGFLTVKYIMEQIANTGEYSGIQPATIVVDSLTTLSEFCMHYVLNANSKPINSQPTLPDYGRQMRELVDIVHWGVAAECHFICIAHQQFTKDENTGRLWCLPLVTGKLAYNIGAYFDEIYYAQAKEVSGQYKFTLLTKPNNLVVAKSRLDLPTTIDTDYNAINTVLQDLRASAQKAQVANAQKGGGTQAAAQALGINANQNPKP